MQHEWLKYLNELASDIAPDWLAGPELPLPSRSYVERAAEWRKMPFDVRKDEIGGIQAAQVSNKPLLLFLLWALEPSADLRIEIVRGFPKDEPDVVDKILKKIFRNESPDFYGKAVRDEVIRFLTDNLAPGPGPGRAVLGAGPAGQRTRATLGGGGAKQRPGLGPTDSLESSSERDSADATMAELNRLRSMNPWL